MSKKPDNPQPPSSSIINSALSTMKMHTPDLTQENIAKLAELFPDCVTESRDEAGNVKQAIDFDQLRQVLSDHAVEGPQERYHLNWPGKREALLAANAPIAKTLRPCRDESIDFDTTRNLFIEGDNLDALKLLQETYLGKVKMIYIDPPYNTGQDFLYEDNFAVDASDYFIRSGQAQEDARLVANTEANGRFHSDWLSSVFPRLRVARNILRSDGVIFVSINDVEHPNLRKVCDEVFGEQNFLGCVVWKNATDNNPSQVVVEHEYIVVYCRDRQSLEPSWQSAVSDVKEVLVRKGKELVQQYPDNEERQLTYTQWFRQHKAELWPLDGYKHIDDGGVYAGIRGVHNPGKEGYRYDVIHPITKQPCKQPLMGYRFPKETMDKLLAEGRIIFGDDHTKLIELKAYAQDYQEKLSSLIELDGRSAAYDIRDLFPEFKSAFKNPKPVKLLQRLIPLILKSDGDTIMDFYAGSGTTAQAVIDLNRSDGVARQFVMIQLDEPCNPDSEVAKAGIATISDFCMERIRRAGRRAKEAAGLHAGNLDVGFRVLRIDSSNMKDVYYRPDQATPELLGGHIDNIKGDRTDEDLLFQVLLDWGVDLSLPVGREQWRMKNGKWIIEKVDTASTHSPLSIINSPFKTVFFVDENALAACLETGIDEEFVKALAARKPLRAVFRDTGYGSDDVKINVEQIFRQLSPGTEVKTL